MPNPSQIGSSINRAVIGLTGSDKPLSTQDQARVDQRAQMKSGIGIISGKDLMERMGGEPLRDIKIFGLTIKTNSAAYKEALDHLETYQAMAEQFGDLDLDNLEAVKAPLSQELNKVIAACDAYIAKHEGDDSKAGRRSVMADLKAKAEQELQALETLSTRDYGGTEKVFIKESLALERVGLTDGSAFNDELNDETLSQDKSALRFDSGKINTVSRLVYETPDGDKVFIGKPLFRAKPELESAEKALGLDRDNCRFLERNKCSESVANVMGLPDLIPSSVVVMHEGRPILAMAEAPGEAAIGSTQIRYADDRQADFDGYVTNFGPEGARNYLPGEAKRMDDGWYEVRGTTYDYPFASGDKPKLTASLQEQLLDLQLLDVLNGQLDRHLGNIFIRIDGDTAQVTGIDNDISFGVIGTIATGTGSGLWDTAFPGAPPLMSRASFDKLDELFQNQDGYREMLAAGGLNPAEIDAAVSRLQLLHAHAQELEQDDRIVDDYETWTKTLDDGRTMNASQYLTEGVGPKVQSYVSQLHFQGEFAKHHGHVETPDPTKHGAL